MPTTSSPFSRRERDALCDLALELGPDAPTCCGDWDVRRLVAHLLVRERSPWASPGLVLAPLAGLVERAMDGWAERPFESAVARLRTPALPLLVPGVDALVNTAEMFVHHEDLRRARPDWEPRDLSGDADVLWRQVRTVGRALVRPAGVPVKVVRPDTGAECTLRGGDDPVVVTGSPAELLVMLFNRPTQGLAYGGPPDRVAALRDAQLGF